MYGEIAYKYGHITRTINMHGEIVHKCGHINIHNRYDEIEAAECLLIERKKVLIIKNY